MTCYQGTFEKGFILKRILLVDDDANGITFCEKTDHDFIDIIKRELRIPCIPQQLFHTIKHFLQGILVPD